MKKFIFIALLALVFCGCETKKSTGHETKQQDSTNVAETSIATPTETKEAIKEEEVINVDWQYSESIDKLNDIKHYQATIASTDGRGILKIGTIDLYGNGKYDYTVGFGWLDECLPNCYDEIYIGIKIPSDAKWRKVPFSCGGNAGAVTDMYQDDIIDLLKSNRQFYILLGNEEFTFNPSETLRWGSWDSKHIPYHHIHWGE